MLANLLEVYEGVLQALADGCHAAQSGPLELLALEQTLTIFEEAHVIAGDGLNKPLGRGKLAESNAEMTVYPLSIPVICSGSSTYSASYNVFSKSRWKGWMSARRGKPSIVAVSRSVKVSAVYFTFLV